MRVFTPALLLCLFSLLPQQLPSISKPGIVAGVVGDNTGAVIPGATVTLRAPSVERSNVTNERGEFRFEGVAAGTYRIEVSLEGFRDLVQELTVGAEVMRPLRLTLEVGAMQETVMVTAEAATVQASMSTSGNVPSEVRLRTEKFDTADYDKIDENPFRAVTHDPLSTFSIDVDTASYANVRRFLNDTELPPADAVRIEELINYFRFSYQTPSNDVPFSVTTEVADCPWNPRHRLALIGLQARPMSNERTPPRNLTFLLDVSGSMNEPERLPLVKTAMRMLVDTLNPADRVAIVVYAGSSGLVLPPTPGSHKEEIQRAIADLGAGGSTNGAQGIRLAYETASKFFVKGGINRVILATDGDFNVGVTSEGELVRLIEEQREKGIFLSVLGVGDDNLNDSMMEKLADRGNGNYAYLDTVHEARRVLVAEAGATLITVAKDVKIQVEFNPRTVGAYRLIGYENRVLDDEDFNDDKKDAGEIGAGHTVTALYEIAPPNEPVAKQTVDPLKYQSLASPKAAANANELMTVKLRYKQPDGDTSRLISVAVRNQASELSPNLGFAAAVAEFGMLLRNSPFKGAATWSTAADLARRHRGADPDGYRAEFIRLIELASALEAQSVTPPQGRR